MKSVGVEVVRNNQNDGHTIAEAVDLIGTYSVRFPNPSKDKRNLKTKCSPSSVSSGNGKVQWFALAASILCLMSYAVDILGFGLVIPAAECDLQMDTFRKGLLSSAPFIGFIISTHSWGFLADFIGRRKTICLSLTSCAIISFLAAITPNFWIILSLRLATGIRSVTFAKAQNVFA